MAQVSYGTITVSDLTDITDVYLEYCLALNNANADAVSKRGTASGIAWQTGEVSWSTTYPTWVSGYQIWIRQVTEKEGLPNEYGTPYLDTAVNQINNTFDTKLKYFWINQINSQAYPAGTYTASGINGVTFDTEDSSTYGYNTHYGNGISLRYNAVNMATLNGSALTFYQPPTISGNTVTPGNKAMVLSGNALAFYKPNDEVTAAAILNSTGLNISDGTIDLTSSETDRVHLSTRNLSNAATINGESTVNWRLILGNKFGVTKEGYMSAASGKIGGWSINSTSLYSLNKTEWDKDAEGIFIGSHIDEDDATRTIFTISGGKRQYVKTEDIEVNEEQTYYKLVNDEYEEVSASEISEGTNPKSNNWYISLGPMWYINSDGSASFGSLLVNQSGSLDVPAASISGKLTADQIEVNNLGAISANIGSTINSETTSNSFEVNSEKKIINSLDTKIVDKKEYIGEIPKSVINELEDYPTGYDYLLETNDTASYIIHRTPVNNAALEATFYCNTTEKGATKTFYYGTEDIYIFDDTEGQIWIEYDGQTTFTIYDGFDGTRLINIIYNADQTIDTSLQEIVEESFIKLNTHKSNYNLTIDSTRKPGKIYYEFNPDYVLTDDEGVRENTRYYIQNIDSGNVSYSLVETPLSNPKENNYYELHPKYTINDGTGNPSNSNLYEVTSEYSGGIVLQEGSVSILSNEQIVAKTDETNSTLNLYDIELIGQMDVGNLRIMSHDNGLVVTIGD